MPDRPRHEPQREPDEEHTRAEVEQEQPDEKRTKPESEMRGGKDHAWELPENHGEYDPATTRTPQGGAPD